MKLDFVIPDLRILKSYIERISNILPDYYNGIKNASIIKAGLLFFSGSFFIPSFNYKNKKLLICTHQHIHLFSKSDLKKTVIAGGLRELFWAVRYRTGFINTSWLYMITVIYSFIMPKCRIFYVQAFVGFSNRMKQMDCSALLFIDSDGLPYKRSLCLAAQQVDRRVVCLQHGIFHFPSEGIDGSLCDLNIALDDSQLKLFLNSGISSERLALLRSVVIVEEDDIANHLNQKRKVILAGEGWGSHDKTRQESYLNTLLMLKKQLHAVGITAYYRPHPSEKYAVWSYYKLFPVIFAGRSRGVFSCDIYIGASSSILVDAVKNGAQSIQMENLLGIGANFENYGVIRCSVDNVVCLVSELLIKPRENNVLYQAHTIRYISLDKLLSLLLLSRKVNCLQCLT